MNSYVIKREGGLYKIAKMSQQEYGAAFVLNNEKTSIANPMRTFLASLAKYVSKLSSTFHVSMSDGCPMTHSFLCIPYLCHLMCLMVLSQKKNCFN
jgi:hypothetical protein